jgi:hydrogenase maturation factor HypF (carbamoyltransferase family)
MLKIFIKKQHSCQDCNESFTTLNRLNVNKNTIHLKKLLKCKNCEKIFTNYSYRDNRREHLKLTFECQKCKKNLQIKGT